MPVSFSFSVCAAQNSRSSLLQHEAEESPTTARRELQLLEDHRPWEMLDNIALGIIDQTYAALVEILRPPPPSTPEGDDGHVFSVSQRVGVDATDSPEPPPMLCVEASARHCRFYVTSSFHSGDTGREFTTHAPPGQRSRWPPRHRLTRASIGASLGTLSLARVDGGRRGDYWKCADDEVSRPDVAGKGLLGVLDAATRLEGRLLEMARARRCRGTKVREIFRVWMALEDMRRRVDLDVIVRRGRFQKRHRVGEISCRPAAEMDVDREDEAEILSKRLKALVKKVVLDNNANVLHPVKM